MPPFYYLIRLLKNVRINIFVIIASVCFDTNRYYRPGGPCWYSNVGSRLIRRAAPATPNKQQSQKSRATGRLVRQCLRARRELNPTASLRAVSVRPKPSPRTHPECHASHSRRACESHRWSLLSTRCNRQALDRDFFIYATRRLGCSTLSFYSKYIGVANYPCRKPYLVVNLNLFPRR